MRPIETDDLTIHFDGKTCIHARRCVLGLPGVFDPDARPWIQPENGTTDEIVRVIEACPSGALTYERKGGENETPPKMNTVHVWENGPLEVRGDIRVAGDPPRHRAVICRCGRTTNPPYCDNSHLDGFQATGLPGVKQDKDTGIEAADGPLEISASNNGSIAFRGNMEVVAADGSRIARTGKAWLCRCGSSGNKPFCDGSHGKIGFTKPARADAAD